MNNKTIYRMLLAAVTVAAMTGCESQLKSGHEKFVAKDHAAFDKQKLDIQFQVAEQQYKVGDLSKCRESIKKALADTTSTPYAPIHVLAARVELEGGNLEVASTELKQAISIDGTKPEPYYLLGVVYQRWQKFDTAADYYQQAADKNPGEALYVLAVAEMEMTLGQLDKAKQLLEDKMLYFEQSASMRIALARIAQQQGDPALAARMYRDANMLLPEDKELRWTYANSLYDAGKFSDAARILEDLRRDPPVLVKDASAQAKGDFTNSATDDEAAIATKVGLLSTLGECYISLKRPMDARDCFQEIIRAQPDNVSAYLSLGKACLMTNDLSTTTAAAQKALRFEPENVQAMLLQAAVQQKMERWTESLDTLNRAVSLSPKDLTVLCMLGISELQLGQKDAAAAAFERAVAINPRDVWANDLLRGVKPMPVIKQTPATPEANAGELRVSPMPSNMPATVNEPTLTNALPGESNGQ